MQHPYLGQETASPGKGEMLLSDLRGGSLVLGLGQDRVRVEETLSNIVHREGRLIG